MALGTYLFLPADQKILVFLKSIEQGTLALTGSKYCDLFLSEYSNGHFKSDFVPWSTLYAALIRLEPGSE